MPENTVKPTTPAEPLDRIWSEPIGTGEPVPFDPELYEPPMPPEELQKMLEEDDKQK